MNRRPTSALGAYTVLSGKRAGARGLARCAMYWKISRNGELDIMGKQIISICLLSSVLVFTACESGAPRLGMREKGALTGGALGAGLGAIVGNQVGSPGAGVAIGGATGALAGALVGEAQDQQDEDREYQDERLRRQEEELRRQRRELEELRRGERSYEDDYRYSEPSRGPRYDDRRY
jgi:hypothetical protein